MDQKENVNPMSNEKNNKPILQNKSSTPDKIFNNLKLSNLNNLKPICLEKNFSQEKDNNKIFLRNNIKYGIDESGNPINIKEYYKSINESVNLNSNTSIFSGITSMNQKLKKPIAYITKDENDNNILIDLKGNKITTKNKDGDYDFPLQLHVIIKDFDVKHPELRVNGERYYKDNNDIIEDIEIGKEINENEISKINKTSESNNLIYSNEKINQFEKKISNNNDNKNEIGNLIYRTNTNINKNNIYYTKYSNINLYNENNNKIVLKTTDILNSDKSLSSIDKVKNVINFDNNNARKKLPKNRSFLGPILKNNTYNFHNLKYKRELSDNHKINHNINNKMTSNKSSLNNNSNYFIKEKFKNIKKMTIRNKNKLNEKLNTDINKQIKLIYPKRNILGRNENHEKFNNKNKYIKTEQIGNDNISLNNYFIIKDNIGDKEKLLQKMKKKPIIIPINNKNNNIIIDYNEKVNNNNININKIKNLKINSNDLSQRIKKIEIKKNDKKRKYYVLSVEADNMIKSYSRNKYKENSKEKSKLTELSTKIRPNYKYKKINLLTKNNLNSNNSYFSSSFNNNNISKKENELKTNTKGINQKYVGITLSLPNNVNNKYKNLKANNQININFTPYQIQCESLIKNNNTNNQQDINENLLKNKNKKNIKKNFFLPNYEIYL